MKIKIRPEWDLDDPADIKMNRDGSITFEGPVGDVFLPQDYLEVLKISGLDHEQPLVPKGYNLYIGKSFPHHLDRTKGEFDVLLCCLKDHHDYGKVFVWPRSDDPWMEGTNTIGLGFVADNFSEFINNLTARENL